MFEVMFVLAMLFLIPVMLFCTAVKMIRSAFGSKK